MLLLLILVSFNGLKLSIFLKYYEANFRSVPTDTIYVEI